MEGALERNSAIPGAKEGAGGALDPLDPPLRPVSEDIPDLGAADPGLEPLEADLEEETLEEGREAEERPPRLLLALGPLQLPGAETALLPPPPLGADKPDRRDD